jgi:hypothetical protein
MLQRRHSHCSYSARRSGVDDTSGITVLADDLLAS